MSAGVRDPGEAMVMYGTTMFFVAVCERPLVDRRLKRRRCVLWDLDACRRMAASGSVVVWGRDLHRRRLPRAHGRSRLCAEAGAGGLLVLPYFAGERTPLFDAQARGTIFGLTLRHRRAHLFRALLEATAYGARHDLETFQDAGARLERVVAVGGGTASELWPQIVSDVTNLEQEVPSVTIGAAVPRRLPRRSGHSVGRAFTRWASIEGVVKPNPAATEGYEELFALYRRAYVDTADTSHALAALQEADPGDKTMNSWSSD